MAGHVDDVLLRKYAQKLAGNDKTTRDRAFRKLKKWFDMRCRTVNGKFTEEDLIKIWKGLHYCMWMQDKPIIQEELADKLCSLIQCFKSNQDLAFLFVDVFFQTQVREWQGIDQLRLDKFMMLFRKILHQSFVLLKQRKWSEKSIEMLTSILSKQLICSDLGMASEGLRYHLADIFIPELTKSVTQQMNEEQLLLLLKPWCAMLAKYPTKAFVNQIVKRVFMPLIDSRINSLEAKSEDKEEHASSQELKVDFGALADHLFKLASSEETCMSRNRNNMYQLVTIMRDLVKGTIQEPEVVDASVFGRPIKKKDIERTAESLAKFEEKLFQDSARNKRKRKADQLLDGLDEKDSTIPLEKKKVKKQKINKDISNNAKQRDKSKKKAKTANSEINSNSELEKVDQKTKVNGQTLKNQHKNDQVKSAKMQESYQQVKDMEVASTINDDKKIVENKETQKHKKRKKEKDEVTDIVDATVQEYQEDASTQNINLDEDTVSKDDDELYIDRGILLSDMLDDDDNDGDKKLINTKRQKSDKSCNTLKMGHKKKKSNKKNKNKLKVVAGTNTKIMSNESEGATDKKLLKKEKRLKHDNDMHKEIEEMSKKALGKTRKRKSTECFAKFETGSKPPPAFVKRAMAMTTPKSERKKQKMKMKLPDAAKSDPGKKRVIFKLSKNDVQEFAESLSPSLASPFNPQVKPDCGILKLTPVKVKLPKNMLFKKKKRL